MKFVKTALLLVVIIGLTVSTVMPIKTYAQSYDMNREEMLQQIEFLQSLLASLLERLANMEKLKTQSESEPETNVLVKQLPYLKIESTDPKIDGKPTIEITSPHNNSKFSYPKNGEATFEVSWEADNIPPNSVVEWEHKFIRIYDNIGSAGGGGQVEIPAGDSIGTRIERYGKPAQSPGEYKVRVFVRECHSKGCELNPEFPGQEEDLKVYATSKWHYYTLGDIDTEVYETDGVAEINNIKPQNTSVTFGESTNISWELSGVPDGDYRVCVTMENRILGKSYAPTNPSCKMAKNGIDSMKWTPLSSWMPADDYRITVTILKEDDSSGKDRGTLAKRQGDWFTLKPQPKLISKEILGTYYGYMNESQFIMTKNISEKASIENCELNASHNPTLHVYCTWNGKIIYENKPNETTSVIKPVNLPIIFTHPERSGVYKEGDNMLVSWSGTSWPTGLKFINLDTGVHTFWRDAFSDAGTFTLTIPRLNSGNYQIIAYTYNASNAPYIHVGASEVFKIE